MRSRNGILAATLAALVLLAPSSVPALQFKAAIEGVVREQETGLPMDGVKVYFTNAATWPRDPQFVVSDPKGQFVIEVRAAGRYRLLPERAGYVYSRPARFKAPRLVVSVEVSEQGTTAAVELSMAREGVIVGQILDSLTGQPMPSVLVNPAVARYGNNGEIFAALDFLSDRLQQREIRTNDRGEYRVFGLQQGEYYVVYNRYVYDRTAPIAGPLLGYYPGVDRLASATLLQVDAGKETRATPILMDPPSKAVQVRLRYGGTDPQSAPGVAPSMMSTADNWSTWSRVGRDNDETTVRMLRGHHDLTFQVPSGTGDILYSRMSFDVGTENLEKEVLLTSAVNVTGVATLKDAAGKTLDGSGISCSVEGEGQLPKERTGRGARAGCIDAAAVRGNYQLRVSNLPADAFVMSAKSGQRDVLRDGIDASTDVYLEIEAATPGAVISGVVRDDNNNPMSDAAVALVPDAPYRNAFVLYRSDSSAFDGKFVLRGVAPGAYRVFAWAELNGPAYRNAEFLKKYEARGTPLKIETATPVSLNLIAIE
jgi:hypothetical protein